MKKILFFSHAMEIGGAERALLGILENIDTTIYQVDLFLMRHTGELLEMIPDRINLLPEIPQYACLAVSMKDVLKIGQFGVAFGRYCGKRRAKKRIQELGISGECHIELDYSHKYTLKYMPQINTTEYDLAISFLTPHYFVANRVRAKKKIAWIHTDYSVIKIDVESEKKMWGAYDKIVSISESVGEAFGEVFPSLREKLVLIENIQPQKLILKQMDAFKVDQEMSSDSIRLLSIGRYSFAKNFDNVPFICKGVRESDLNVRWYLIGYGGEERLIRQRLEEAGLDRYVVMLGKKDNPYPYIKACDLYVQPSRYEGKCVAVREAQMLCKPVVITNYATSDSQLENGVDGVVVPMDNEGCAKGIVDVLNNPGLMKKLSDNCKKRDYSNADEIKKIYQLLDM